MITVANANNANTQEHSNLHKQAYNKQKFKKYDAHVVVDDAYHCDHNMPIIVIMTFLSS